MRGRATIPAFPVPRILVAADAMPRHYRCPPDWSCDLQLREFDLWFVLRGSGQLRIDGQLHAVVGPQLFLFQPGQRVLGTQDPREPLEVCAFHFSVAPRDVRTIEALAQRTCGVVPRDPVRLQEHCAWLVDAAHEADAGTLPHVEAIGLAILMQLWRDLHQPPALPGDWRIEALVREICRRPRESWNTRQMVKQAGLSESHLAKRFRALTGLSPRQFAIRRRIGFAETLMTDTQLSLEQIADAAGYRDVFFFSRQFKQVKGLPPAAYRQARGGRVRPAGR